MAGRGLEGPRVAYVPCQASPPGCACDLQGAPETTVLRDKPGTSLKGIDTGSSSRSGSQGEACVPSLEADT